MSDAQEFATIRDGESGEVLVRCFGPGRSEDGLSSALRVLTHQLTVKQSEADRSGGVFGGEYGYGVSFENDVFLMHPYCWCDNAECPWCAGCACADDATQCAWCRGVHRWAERGALPPHEWPSLGAPHFWHKPTGLRVWWYKYIGRGMEMHPGTATDVEFVINACLASIGSPVLADAWGEYLAAEERAAQASTEAMDYWASDEGQAIMDKMLADGVIHIL
jgi:hypothetical protein